MLKISKKVKALTVLKICGFEVDAMFYRRRLFH